MDETPVTEDVVTLTREEADLLYHLLRSLCIVGPSHTLHIGGHVVEPPQRKPRRHNGRDALD
jgi:hypothetical protein